MKNKFFSAACIIFILVSAFYAQEPKWLSKIRQIVPLRSTVEDVENLYSKPSEAYANVREYRLKYGVLTVTYSTGECSSGGDEYNVKKGTILGFSFWLKKPLEFKSLKIDTNKFLIEPSDDTPNMTYRSPEAGLSYSTYLKNKNTEMLQFVMVYPAKRFDDLECFKK